MNISGISPSAVIPASDVYANEDAPVNVSMAVSVQVLDMAQNVFEDIAEKLIAEMVAQMTGIGQNIDTYA